MSNRRALCVGINQFMNFPGASLQGCVSDANSMATLLKTWLGFKDPDITKLTDAQATKANIMAALNSMVADAKAGKLNYLVFSLASHGTQVPDQNRDEEDGTDEAFCPHDLAQAGSAWDPNHIIIDDELHDIFVQLPASVLLEVYLDTCHSGTGLRDVDVLLDRKPRYLPPPSWEAFNAVRGRQSRGPAIKMVERGLAHNILWTGCRADQTSADANIGGAWHGAFTYFFCKVMNASKNKLARKAVLSKVRSELAAAHYTQIPQLECDATTRAASIA